MNTEEKMLALEKEALDNWSGGNPAGYFKHAATDATYIDDIGAQNRIEGVDSALTYGESIKEMIPEHKYKIVNPKIQTYGDTAILSYFYHPTSMEGEPGTKWRSTVIYIAKDNEWKVVHCHWTMLKDQ